MLLPQTLRLPIACEASHGLSSCCGIITYTGHMPSATLFNTFMGILSSICDYPAQSANVSLLSSMTGCVRPAILWLKIINTTPQGGVSLQPCASNSPRIL